ncbi:hypothetical protein [Cesiribacter sp. SM1]|uniref:hypothetical protein n=1 Tax=Cesiribacter sp. SM1 TaxID=2861196 RepID=UPI001CD5C430|nr:hypothetical protein [Cesiribacter sp. SM1]
MKANLVYVLFLSIALGCNPSSEELRTDDSAAPPVPAGAADSIVQNLCFIKVEGLQNQDSAWIHLEITGNHVRGSFVNLPYEKDSRKGKLQGTKNGSSIDATWIFMQEGQLDTLPVQFRMSNNHLLKKPYSYSKTTGEEFIADSSAFNVAFQEIDCYEFHPIDL